MSKNKSIFKIISFSLLSLVVLYLFFSNVHAASGCGDYPGTYSFTNDVVGSNPNGWTVNEGLGAINVVNNTEDHHMVVEFNDAASSTLSISQSFSGINAGVVEFWILASQVDHNIAIKIADGASSTDYLSIMLWYDGDFKYFHGVVSDLPVGTSYSVDTWIHVNINFNCTESDYSVYINGEFKGDCDYYGDPDEMNFIELNTGYSDEGKFYFDALGYSWDTGYTIGDNLVESCPDNPTSGNPEDNTAIPGYDLLIICGTSSIIIVGVYVKKKKKI